MELGIGFSVCIDKVFSDGDFLSGMRTVKQAGVDAYEFWKWWEKDVGAILHAQSELGLKIVAFCTKFVSLLEPELRAQYLAGLRESIETAKRFGCANLISQVGYSSLDKSCRPGQLKSIVAGLRESVPLLEESGITLLVEPINTVDQPGYFLSDSEESFAIVDAVGSSQVKILYDIYHFQVTEGDLIRTIRKNIKSIGHFHAAGNPGRNNIIHGEINYCEVFRAIHTLGYSGYIGLECFADENKELEIREALKTFQAGINS